MFSKMKGGCGTFKAPSVRFHLVVVDENQEKHQSGYPVALPQFGSGILHTHIRLNT
jgi:hypothetical protein